MPDEYYEPESVTEEVETYAAGTSPAADSKTASARAALDHAARDQNLPYHQVADEFNLDAKIRDMNPTPPVGTVVPDPATTDAQRMAGEIANQGTTDGVRAGIISGLRGGSQS